MFLLTGIPRSGNRWLMRSLGITYSTPWYMKRKEIPAYIGERQILRGHIPAFPEIRNLNHLTVVYLSRRNIRDQIVSWTNHQSNMIPPPYIEDYQPWHEIPNAIRTNANIYPLLDPWLEHADHVVFYEDLCEDFEKATAPIYREIEHIDLQTGIQEAHKPPDMRTFNKGCSGINQYLDVWNDEYEALYQEHFQEIESYRHETLTAACSSADAVSTTP